MLSVFRLFVASLGVLLIPYLAVAQEPAPTALTQTQAIDEAMIHSPRMAAAAAAIEAAQGGLRQAGAYANPSLGVEGENIGGNGQYKGFDSAELTYGLSQPILLAGKVSAREEAAAKQLTIARLDAEMTRLDVRRDVEQAFATAVAAQESLRLAEDALSIARQELRSVSHRVAEAASPRIQKSKAEVTLATAEFNVEQARQDQATARMQLATLLGRPVLHGTLDASSFFAIGKPDAGEEAAIERTPDMLRLRLMEEHAQALLDIEKTNAVPDPVVNFGVRELRQTDDRAFVLGLSIPLPVMDSNRGNIVQARADMARTASEQQAIRLELLQRHQVARTALFTAYRKATSYSGTVLPAAEDAFRLARQGYSAGKFQYLEVLDAQRTLFGARVEYMASLRDYHMRKAELERLTAPYAAKEKGEEHAHR